MGRLGSTTRIVSSAKYLVSFVRSRLNPTLGTKLL